MGGLQCAKSIIDQRNALVQQLDCMGASILLAAPSGLQPTEKMLDEFVSASNLLAAVAAKIEKYVRDGGAEDDAGEITAAEKLNSPEV